MWRVACVSRDLVCHQFDHWHSCRIFRYKGGFVVVVIIGIAQFILELRPAEALDQLHD